MGGAEIALVRHPQIRFLIFGDQAVLRPWLEKYPRVASACDLVHTEVAISMHDKPSQALRRGRKTSSMWCAIDAVKTGQAQAAVSAGNTGALMAMAKVILKTMPDVERPALAALWPTARGESVALDLGATVGADARQLVQFATMGEAFGIVLLEANACGVPVAAFPVTGPQYLIRDGVNGCLDTDLRAAALRALTLSRTACRQSAAAYSWEACTLQFLGNLARNRAAFPLTDTCPLRGQAG